MDYIRKYLSEVALDVYIDSYTLLPANELKDYIPKIKHNLYYIMSGYVSKIIKVELKEDLVRIFFSYGEDTYVYEFNQKEFSNNPLSQDNFKISKNQQVLEIILSENDLNYIENYYKNKINVSLKNGKFSIKYDISYILHNYFINYDKSLNFDLLYIGQAYGKNNDREAVSRLKNHSTLQKILADCLAEYPNKMIYILLLSINSPQLILGIDGLSKDTQTTFIQDSEHIINVLKNAEDNSKFKQIVNITEALLINFFKPKYNILLKSEFPNKKSKGYQDYFTLDYNKIFFEFQPEIINVPQINFKTNSKVFSQGIISYTLHNDKNRKSIFDIFEEEKIYR